MRKKFKLTTVWCQFFSSILWQIQLMWETEKCVIYVLSSLIVLGVGVEVGAGCKERNLWDRVLTSQVPRPSVSWGTWLGFDLRIFTSLRLSICVLTWNFLPLFASLSGSLDLPPPLYLRDIEIRWLQYLTRGEEVGCKLGKVWNQVLAAFFAILSLWLQIKLFSSSDSF